MTTNCTDLVSVILPAYNAERYIGSAIKSVLRQTYPYFEIIVVDDGSTDKTAEVVKQFKDKRIYLIQHPENKGVSAARNTAMKHAKGKWFAILDADDEWLPERIEKLMKILFESGNNYFIGDDQILCFETPKGLKEWISFFKSVGINLEKEEVLELSLTDYWKWNFVRIKPIFPSEPIKNFNLKFNPSIQYGEDLEFICNLFRIGLKLKIYAQALYLYRLNPESITGGPGRISNSTKALEMLSKNKNFTVEERHLFKISLEKTKKGIYYRHFTYLLKNKKFLQSGKILFKHPYFLIKLLYSLPHSLKYRLAAKKAGGRIK